MLVFLIILIISLTLAIMPLHIGMNLYINLFDNSGLLKVYFFGIRVFKAQVHFEHRQIKENNLIIEHGKKKDEIHLNNDANDKKSIAAMIKKPLLKNIRIEKLSAHFILGKTNDAFFTVALLQAIRVMFYSVMAAIKCRYNTKITESFTPVYNNDILQTDIIGIIEVSIADIIIDFTKSLFKMFSYKKQELIKS